MSHKNMKVRQFSQNMENLSKHGSETILNILRILWFCVYFKQMRTPFNKFSLHPHKGYAS
jgi:hypothetical protein